MRTGTGRYSSAERSRLRDGWPSGAIRTRLAGRDPMDEPGRRGEAPGDQTPPPTPVPPLGRQDCLTIALLCLPIVAVLAGSGSLPSETLLWLPWSDSLVQGRLAPLPPEVPETRRRLRLAAIATADALVNLPRAEQQSIPRTVNLDSPCLRGPLSTRLLSVGERFDAWMERYFPRFRDPWGTPLVLTWQQRSDGGIDLELHSEGLDRLVRESGLGEPDFRARTSRPAPE